MSWWSDGEPFDEHDPEYCKYCKGGTSYEECKKCEERHDEIERYWQTEGADDEQ